MVGTQSSPASSPALWRPAYAYEIEFVRGYSQFFDSNSDDGRFLATDPLPLRRHERKSVDPRHAAWAVGRTGDLCPNHTVRYGAGAVKAVRT